MAPNRSCGQGWCILNACTRRIHTAAPARRMQDPTPPGSRRYLYRFGSVEFDEARVELRVAGLRVETEHRVLGVLACLLHHADEVVTKDELLREVWAGRVTVDKVLPNAIAKLRRALGESNAQHLITQSRVGYRLTGPISRTAVGSRITSPFELSVGDAVPGRSNFILRRQLGAGRDGEVWLVEQPRSRVSRVYKFARDGESLRSLKREATLLRVLRESAGDVAHFVELFDWNFEQPPFFLECGYGGQNLLDWSREYLAAMPISERVALFLQLVDAVVAAHAVGVLHKDLKPANVLIAPEAGGWHVRLTDFGSGRLLDPERLDELGITRLGMTVTQNLVADAHFGTPLYMAPEIFSGQAPTARSDVFSLGIMLYQLLAGDVTRPMTSGWEREIEDSLLRDDIGAATDGDPQRRLPGAAELAARLRTLEARRAAAQEAERREIESHQEHLLLARSRARRPYVIALAGALATGLIAVLALWFAASRARDDAQGALARVNAINHFLNEDLIGRSNPLVLSRGGDVSLRDVLLGARDRIAMRFRTDPLTEASIRSSLAVLFNVIELFPEAEGEARRALELRVREQGNEALDTLRERALLTRLLTRTSQFDASREQIALMADAIGDSHDPQRNYLLASARATFAMNQGDYANALPLYRQAIAYLSRAEPDNTNMLDSLRLDLIGVLTQTHQFEEARSEGQALISEIRQRGDDDGLVAAFARAMVARAYTLVGDPDRAEAELLEAQKPIARLLGEQHSRNLMILNDLYSVAMRRRDWTKAIDYGTRTYDGLRAKFGDNHNFTNIALANLGQAYYENGQASDAVPRLRVAYDQLIHQLTMRSPQTQATGFWLAAALIDVRSTDAAAELAAGLDPGTLQSVQADGLWPVRLDLLRGLILAQRGHSLQAQPLLRKGAEELAGHDPSDTRLVEQAATNLRGRN